jgi:holo-[acyl-carrier-protein] synthase
MTLAGNFAGKEAVSKALGTGFKGFYPIDIEILRTKLGTPYVILYGKALKISKEMGIQNIHISISHCKEYAIAYAVAER